MTKKWYQSKTLWFNLLALVAAVAANYGYTGELSPEWEVFAPVIVVVVNLVLRLVTKEPIEKKLI
jgi:membrane protein YdbS with pleckstrin-like domain